MLNRVLKTGLLSVVFSALQALLSLFLAGYSLKVLGVDFIGKFQLVQAIYLFIFPFLGVPILLSALINYVAEQASKKEWLKVYKMLEVSLGYFVISNIILALIIIVYQQLPISPISKNLKYLLFFAVLIAVVEQLNALLSAYFSGRGWFVSNQFLTGIFGLLLQLSVFIGVYLTKRASVYVSVMFAGSLLKVIVFYFVICFKEKRIFLLSFKLLNVLKMPMFTKAAYVGALSTPFMTQGDRLILSYFGGVGSLPFYSIAQRALIFIHSVVYNVTYTLFPILSSEGKNAVQKAIEIDTKIRWVISFISTILYGSVMLIFPMLLTLVAGKEIGDKALIFIVLAAVNGVFVSNSTVATMSLMGLKKIRILAVNTWLNNCLILLLLFIFSNIWGAVGTAIAKLGNLFQMIFTNYFYSKELNLRKLYLKFRPISSSVTVFPFFVISIFLIQNLDYSEFTKFLISSLVYSVIVLIWIISDYQTNTGKVGIIFLKSSFLKIVKLNLKDSNED